MATKYPMKRTKSNIRYQDYQKFINTYLTRITALQQQLYIEEQKLMRLLKKYTPQNNYNL